MPAEQNCTITQIRILYTVKGKLRKVLKDLRVTVIFSGGLTQCFGVAAGFRINKLSRVVLRSPYERKSILFVFKQTWPLIPGTPSLQSFPRQICAQKWISLSLIYSHPLCRHLPCDSRDRASLWNLKPSLFTGDPSQFWHLLCFSEDCGSAHCLNKCIHFQSTLAYCTV